MMTDTNFDDWQPEHESPGGWSYTDEDGETVFVLDDDCDDQGDES